MISSVIPRLAFHFLRDSSLEDRQRHIRVQGGGRYFASRAVYSPRDFFSAILYPVATEGARSASSFWLMVIIQGEFQEREKAKAKAGC